MAIVYYERSLSGKKFCPNALLRSGRIFTTAGNSFVYPLPGLGVLVFVGVAVVVGVLVATVGVLVDVALAVNVEELVGELVDVRVRVLVGVLVGGGEV
jgi:hypothetical protein